MSDRKVEVLQPVQHALFVGAGFSRDAFAFEVLKSIAADAWSYEKRHRATLSRPAKIVLDYAPPNRSIR